MIKSGLILFNKKPGITSFDSLRDIKRALGTGKVGHTGTLDKFAQGLLLVLTGNSLKLSRWFTNCDKQYTGKIYFGTETDTLDPEGNITGTAPLPSHEDIIKILPQFTGEIWQEPPVFSAIHVNGKRASDLVRLGKEPQMKKRKVFIYKLDLLGWEPPFAKVFVHCSSGTYIRSLARDIALAAGSRAHLCELTRTQVGGFSLGVDRNLILAKAQRREERKEEELGINNEEFRILPINKSIIGLLGIPMFDVSQQEAQYIIQGKNLDQILNNKFFNPVASVPPCPREKEIETTFAAFFDEKLVAIVEKTSEKWKYGCVFSS